jgi:hypothetical protein
VSHRSALLAAGFVYPAVMVQIMESCGACQKPVKNGDDFCEGCGAALPPEQKKRLKDGYDVATVDFTPHAKQVQSAQNTIGWLSILFVFGGVVFFFLTRSKGQEALRQLGDADPATPLAHAVAGATTVGELRNALEQGAWQVLGLNLFLAVVMLGLWLWSKRAALPAVITALGIYLAVQVASVLYDPPSLLQGILMKVFIIGALAKGVKSALNARRLELAR